jgi:hypothetical protein
MARHDLPTCQSNAEEPATKTAGTLALISFDDLPMGNLASGTLPGGQAVTVEGTPSITDRNVIWSKKLSGNAIYFPDLPHFVEIPIDATLGEGGLQVTAWVYPQKYSFGTDGREIIAISQGGKRITALRTAKWPKPEAPDAINAKGDILLKSELFAGLTTNRWHKVGIDIAADGKVTYSLDGKVIGEGMTVIQPSGTLAVRLGGFRGFVDDIHVFRAPAAP